MGKIFVGKQCGSLTVLERVEDHIQPSGRHRKMWLCKCVCGSVKKYREDSLYDIQSCGCKRNKDNGIRLTKHSESRSRLYNIYYSMRNRCLISTCSEYNRYGGRGITICDEWIKDFTTFSTWAKENGYDENDHELSLERIDVDGNYCPENCSWIKVKDQYNNRRNTIRMANISLSRFCALAGLSYGKVLDRYKATNDIVYAVGLKEKDKE